MLSNTYSNQDIVELSVSAWFYRNRTIAGFDNPARSLYVAIREIVENSLDACESANVLPSVRVKLEYDSKESEAIGFSSAPEIFLLTVEDNGGGMSKNDLPKLIGKMLTGTKFTHKQSRGTFGLGGSLALLYGQITTQKPITVVTGKKKNDSFHVVSMQLDIEKNEPRILEEKEIPKSIGEQGTTISFHLQGDWIRSKRKIIDYFKQTSIIVPYASISFSDPDRKNHSFKRLIDLLPKKPREVKPHPRGIDVEMLKSMIGVTKAKTLKKFLMKTFQRIGKSTAIKFISHIGISPDIHPKQLSTETLLHIMNGFGEFEGFMIPSSKALSPAGEAVLKSGMNRLNPEFTTATQRAPAVYEGHPFIIEVGIAYGGEITSGLRLYRYANKIPLLYDEGSDVSSRVLKEINMKTYGLRPEDPLAFFVHLCSTKVPYKTVGKEYIADVDVVRREIDLGLKECLRRLGKQVVRKNRVHRKRKRENRLRKYYEFISSTLNDATSREVSLDRLFPGGN